MLAYITGTIKRKTDHALVVVAHDVGYRIAVIEALLHKTREGEKIELHVYQYVRESKSELYGFVDPNEEMFFEQLLSVSGVGPKTALAILGAAPAEKIKSAIRRGDRTIFKGVSGVGTKTAERILIELRESVQGGSEIAPRDGDDTDIVEALINLGYTPAVARSALGAIPDSCEGVEERMKAALKSLGGR